MLPEKLLASDINKMPSISIWMLAQDNQKSFLHFIRAYDTNIITLNHKLCYNNHVFL